MAFFSDLSERRLDPPRPGCARAVNIGWLEPGHPFVEGTVDAAVLVRLRALAAAPVRLMRGQHPCGFCLVELATSARDTLELTELLVARDLVGNGEVEVIGTDGRCYLAPVLIIHYIEVHSYLPPAEFINAVIDPRSQPA